MRLGIMSFLIYSRTFMEHDCVKTESNDKRNDNVDLTWGNPTSATINTVRKHLGKLRDQCRSV